MNKGMRRRLVRWCFIAKLLAASLFFMTVALFLHLTSTIRHRNELRYLEYHRIDSESALSNSSGFDENSLAENIIAKPQVAMASDDGLNSTLLRQAKRHQHLREACEAFQLKPWSAKQYRIAMRSSGVFYVDDHLRYIYCMVPKAACTTWTRVLLIASGQVAKLNPNAISQEDAHHLRVKGRIMRPLARYSSKEIQYRLKHYFKFMFARHPLDRLSSAFRDRLKSDHKMPKQLYNQRIINRYRDYNQSSTAASKNVQFHEFVRFIVDPTNHPSDFNFHWRPQFDLCLPCHVHYDFIGHQETLSADAKVVLARLGPRAASVQFPTIDPDNIPGSRQAAATSPVQKTNWTAKLASKFASVSERDMERLRTVVYAKDFNVFGYE